MKPTQQLIDALHESDIESVRQMSAGQRLLAGPRLFDLSAKFCKAGIRLQHPEAGESRVHALFLERLRLKQAMEGADE